MVNPFMCGSGSFSHQLEAKDDNSRCSTPRKLSPKKSRKSSLSRSRDDKNPFAKRGLDKFSTLLAEVEDKKQKIYAQIPSDDISLVRFTYSDTDSIKPIVVRVRDKKQENKIKNTEKGENKDVLDSIEALEKPHVSIEASEKPHVSIEASEKPHVESSTSTKDAKQGIKNTMKKDFLFKEIKTDSWKPCFYLPAILILVLVFLGFFGRSFAILCACIGWYLVPTIEEGSSSSKRGKKKKKEYARRASDKKITSNDHLFASPETVLTPRKGYRRKSW